MVQNSLCKELLSRMYHVLLRNVSKTLLSLSFTSRGTTRTTAPTRAARTAWCCNAASTFSWRCTPHGRSDRKPTQCSHRGDQYVYVLRFKAIMTCMKYQCMACLHRGPMSVTRYHRLKTLNLCCLNIKHLQCLACSRTSVTFLVFLQPAMYVMIS